MIDLPTILPEYVFSDRLSSSWIQSFIFRRFLAGNPNRLKGEGFYHRLVFSPLRQEYCLQVVLYYRIQIFPYHINDYHPFFVYYDIRENIIRLAYDSGHHNITIAPLTEKYIMTVRFPWHGYKYNQTAFSPPLKADKFCLTNDILQAWWLQIGKPQFKLRSKFVDPWHPGLTTALPSAGSFRDEAVCPYCGAIVLMDTMYLKGTTLSCPIMCPNQHQFTAIYDFCSMIMKSI